MSELSEKLADLRRQDFAVGAPRGEERRVPGGGRLQEFERATIFSSKDSGSNVVEEPFRTTYLELGGPAGELGYPITDSTLTGDASARFIRFERGSLYLSKANPRLCVYKIPPLIDACEVDPEEHGVWHEFEAGSGVVGVHAALLDYAGEEP